jgi:acetylornithine deacetylase/succinyl-diaminopimelate desuccinylase-like protein
LKSSDTNDSVSPHPVELLQKLIRFDTTNPPGNEAECIHFVDDLLTPAGFETQIVGCLPQRPNLVARLRGQGNAPPLLLYGHVDVVTTAGQIWQVPPFEGRRSEGFVWGRGALDMKGGIAMMLAALLRARTQGTPLPGDVILAVVADEEAGGDAGAQYLVENHPGLFDGVRYALGEFGGFTLHVGSRRFYPIMIAEKQICWLRITFRGRCGHGSLPVRGEALAKLAQGIAQLDRHRLPVRVTPAVRLMIEKMAVALPPLTGLILRQLVNPAAANWTLDRLGSRGQIFEPLLHNTVSATIVHGGDKINVIPSEVTLELDGRLVPGSTPDDMIAEVRQLIGPAGEITVTRYDPGPAAPNMGLFDTLAGILREADPEGVPVPLLLSGVTDARFFSRLGIQTYGFLPMTLSPDFNFIQTIHGADERIPEQALDWGANAIYRALERFGT